jgi:adenylate kinase family enzyme
VSVKQLRRVAVVGTSGSGKTHLASRLASLLTVPHIELDGLYNLADWNTMPDEDFMVAVAAVVARDHWVIDGNYSRVRDVIWPRADAVVVLDYDRWRVMLRLLRRSLRRVLRREELWNGNRETWRNLLSWDPHQSILRWAWTTHGRRRAQYAQVLADPRWSDVEFVSFSTPGEAERWLADLALERPFATGEQVPLRPQSVDESGDRHP